MKKILIILTLATISALAAPQTTCPVMGGKINPKQYTDVNGYRIYTCCKPCISKINAAPDKFIAKMKAAGVELEIARKKQRAKNEL